jgi:hypothetical protein
MLSIEPIISQVDAWLLIQYLRKMGVIALAPVNSLLGELLRTPLEISTPSHFL